MGEGVGGCARVCEYVWDEFSEFLPENRVLTSADFNTYPIRIFYSQIIVLPIMHFGQLQIFVDDFFW